jgi:hypothetical protein
VLTSDRFEADDAIRSKKTSAIAPHTQTIVVRQANATRILRRRLRMPAMRGAPPLPRNDSRG